VGIIPVRTLWNVTLLIESNTKEELGQLGKEINDKCGESLQTPTYKLKNSRPLILLIPDDITTSNIEETLIAQNTGLNLALETSV